MKGERSNRSSGQVESGTESKIIGRSRESDDPIQDRLVGYKTTNGVRVSVDQ